MFIIVFIMIMIINEINMMIIIDIPFIMINHNYQGQLREKNGEEIQLVFPLNCAGTYVQ